MPLAARRLHRGLDDAAERARPCCSPRARARRASSTAWRTAVSSRSTSSPSRSPSSSSSTRTTCCDRATMRVFVVVGRSTVTSDPTLARRSPRACARSCRPPMSSPIVGDEIARRADRAARSARRCPRRRARSVGRGRARRERAPRVRCARRRRAGRRRASRRRPRRRDSATLPRGARSVDRDSAAGDSWREGNECFEKTH